MRHFLMLALLALPTVASVAIAQPTGRHFDVGNFDSVDLASSDTLRIASGKGFSVAADGDSRAVATLALSVRNGVLRIARTPGRHQDRGAIVTITMPGLQTMTLSGSGAIEAGKIEGSTLEAHLSGSGSIDLPDVHVRQLRLILEGSGTIATSGQADRVEIDNGGSGRIDASDLATQVLAIFAHGSGDVLAASTGAASVRSADSGDVRVSGHPACAVNSSGSGRVTCG